MGTYILVIPLTIMLGSILMPENTTLHIISSLFGIMSILITTIKNIATKEMAESTNFRIFKVSNVLSLDQKREIFLTECNRIITEKYLGVLKIYNYLTLKLNKKMITNYDNVLDNLNLPSQIKQYSQSLIIELVDNFQKQAVHLNIPWKPIIIGGSIIISLCLGASIANACLTDWAPVIKDTISGLRNITKITAELRTVVDSLMKVVYDAKTGISNCALGLMSLNQRVDAQEHKLEELIKAIAQE